MRFHRCLGLLSTLAFVAAASAAVAAPEVRVAAQPRGPSAVVVSNPDPVGYGDCTLKVQFVTNIYTPQMTTYRFPLPPLAGERTIATFNLRHYNTRVVPDVDLKCRSGCGGLGQPADACPVMSYDSRRPVYK